MGWKGPSEVLQSNPSAIKVSLEQISWESIQVRFEYYQRKRLHNLSGLPIPVLCNPQNRGVFPHDHMEHRMFWSVCCPLSCCWALLKRAWPYPIDSCLLDIYKH